MAYAGDSIDATPNAPFNSPIISSQEELARLADRVSDLALRLCGSEPTPPAANTMANGIVSARLSEVPNGLFRDLEDRGLDMGIKLDRIRYCLNRIERALP
jgi:hypothetical protein